jgi:hypothetical protein
MKTSNNEDDPLVSLCVDGEVFRIRRSRLPAAAKAAAAGVKDWLEEQKAFLDEEDYLALLCSLDDNGNPVRIR